MLFLALSLFSLAAGQSLETSGDSVNTVLGSRVELFCRVPPAERPRVFRVARWTWVNPQGRSLVDDNRRISIVTDEDGFSSTLVVETHKDADFGSYMCQAELFNRPPVSSRITVSKLWPPIKPVVERLAPAEITSVKFHVPLYSESQGAANNRPLVIAIRYATHEESQQPRFNWITDGYQTRVPYAKDGWYTLRGLRPGTDYKLWIQGINGAGPSPWSQMETFRTAFPEPDTFAPPPAASVLPATRPTIRFITRPQNTDDVLAKGIYRPDPAVTRHPLRPHPSGRPYIPTQPYPQPQPYPQAQQVDPGPGVYTETPSYETVEQPYPSSRPDGSFNIGYFAAKTAIVLRETAAPTDIYCQLGGVWTTQDGGELSLQQGAGGELRGHYRHPRIAGVSSVQGLSVGYNYMIYGKVGANLVSWSGICVNDCRDQSRQIEKLHSILTMGQTSGSCRDSWAGTGQEILSRRRP